MQRLPGFDKGLTTRNICIAGLVASWILGILGLIFAGFMIKEGGLRGAGSVGNENPPIFTKFGFPLLANLGVALSTECMGYIHSVSLRWALWREDRLFFNSNLRLFTSTRRFSPHRWYINLLLFGFLVVSYSASAQIFPLGVYASQKDIEGRRSIIYYFGGEWGLAVNGIAVAGLAIGIIGQALISTWCVTTSKSKIPTWSSHPGNTALTCLHLSSRKQPQYPANGTCPASAHFSGSNLLESSPLADRSSQVKALQRTWPVLSYLWMLSSAAVAWAITVLVLTFQHGHSTLLAFFVNPLRGEVQTADVAFLLGPNSMPYFTSFFIASGLQVFFTVGLHSAELAVNTSRDGISRDKNPFIGSSIAAKTIKSKTAPLTKMLGSIQAAITSWHTVTLFVLKPVVYWLFGLSVALFAQNAYNDHDGPPFHEGAMILMQSLPLFALSAACLLLASFITFLGRNRATGPQPAGSGHLQSIIAELLRDCRLDDVRIQENRVETGGIAQKDSLGR
ncbi:hypothetical protein G7Y89_g10458 [Cudoniella acicularis]|uniref:Uncharacterized protein n=1 Tax=Cudoniella acicularis TaxID=354080 RepID=A0A8H4RGE7_9HELO|nr:hypothetical protein G7Y89_g10458 [Cudoniella acicularis]